MELKEILAKVDIEKLRSKVSDLDVVDKALGYGLIDDKGELL